MFRNKFFIGVIAGLALLVGLLATAFFMFTLSQPEHNKLVGTYWQLEAVWVKDTNSFLPPFILPAYGKQTLKFEGETALVGHDGCNSFGGESQTKSFTDKLLGLWHGSSVTDYWGYQAWPDGRFIYKGGWTTLVYCSRSDYNLMSSGEKYLQTLYRTYRYELRTTPLELVYPDIQEQVLLDKQLWLYYVDSETGEEKALVFGPFVETP